MGNLAGFSRGPVGEHLIKNKEKSVSIYFIQLLQLTLANKKKNKSKEKREREGHLHLTISSLPPNVSQNKMTKMDLTNTILNHIYYLVLHDFNTAKYGTIIQKKVLTSKKYNQNEDSKQNLL